MLASIADKLKAGDVYTPDDGATWHTVKEVMFFDTADPETDLVVVVTEKGQRTWLWSHEEIVVRL